MSKMLAGVDGCNCKRRRRKYHRAYYVIKDIPEQSVVKINVGDKIRITAEEFERLSAAFFAELERKFLES
jgi:hypothetical protein